MPYKNKCFSVCRGKKIIKCNKNRKCTMIKGKTKKYCRLSKKYKMKLNQEIIRMNILIIF